MGNKKNRYNRMMIIHASKLKVNECKMTFPKAIEIYAGPGTDAVAIRHTFYTLKKLIHPTYILRTTTFAEICETSWGEDLALFIMPGGVDIPYHQQLRGEGNKNLKNYVERGGSYLGFCAGAYYASQKISFAKGTFQEIIEERELGFFQGTAEGPTLKIWDAQSNSGADLAFIQWIDSTGPFDKNQNFMTYFNGGCHFIQAETIANVTVLARYLTTTLPEPAIIEIVQGKGQVILSGVHCEFAPELFNSLDPYLRPLQRKLMTQEPTRLRLMAHLLERLGINLAPQSLTL